MMEKALKQELALENFAYFLSEFVWIKDEQQQLSFKMEPWPWQLEFAKQVTNPDQRYHVVLKARQLGLTWIMAALAVWTALRPNSNVLILSKRQDDAQKALERAKFIYASLPVWMRPRKMKGNESELRLGHTWNNELNEYMEPSAIIALPATQDAGRSHTATLVIADEWAFHPYAAENWTAIYSTVRQAGRFIGVSTANGTGNLFEEFYHAAVQEENTFQAYFFSCWNRPGFDEEAYEEAKKNAESLRAFHQEYPRYDTEAFSATGGCIFDVERLEYMLSIAEEMPEVEVPATYNRLRGLMEQYDIEVYELPNRLSQYVCGTDTAVGQTEDADYSCSVIINCTSKKVAAVLWGHIDMEDFGAATRELMIIYNWAFWGVEVNGGFGDAAMIAAQYPFDRTYFYEDPNVPAKDRKKAKRPGWNTNRKTKPILESKMKSAVKYGDIIIPSQRIIGEMKNYVEDPNKPGKTGAVGKNHDDRVMATMIAYLLSFEEQAVRVRRPRPEPVVNQRARWR